MTSSRIRVIACLSAAFVWTGFNAAHAQTLDPEPRDAIIKALERLIATGEPEHATHDAGEWLQLAVDDAIGRGDVEVERLAIRAASPLSASIDWPVTPADHPASLQLNALTVLKVARPQPYSAHIYVSVDGGEPVQMPDQTSGKRGGFRIDRLGEAAAQPGFHNLRVRARLTFGDPGKPAWTEVRDLPPMFYAIYDSRASSPSSARGLVYGPAAVPVRAFDPLLGEEPFAVWLNAIIARQTPPSRNEPEWTARYCSERTAEAGSRPVPTAICAAVHFVVNDEMVQLWFHTADVRVTDDAAEWVRTSPPRFEGLAVRRSAPEQRLSALPLLLAIDPPMRPMGDVVIAPEDIVVTPPTPDPGAPATVTVTVRNQGLGDLHKVAVGVSFGSNPLEGARRMFVVDVPARGSVDVALNVAFPHGFGFVSALASQISEYAPLDSWAVDPTQDKRARSAS
jgi:hypothetical protein